MKKPITLLFLMLILSSSSLLGQSILFTEDFDYAPGPLPADWVIDADEPPGWSINNSQISGGTAPELYMTYGFQVGLSRLISPVIDVDGYEHLAIRYKQYMINYAGDWGETIGMDATFDGGTTWQVLWDQPLGLLNIPQDEFIYYVASGGASEMQIAFRFEGNNNAINGWAIDDITVEDVFDNDLLVSSFSGTTTPTVGQEAVYTVEVTNGGKLTQNNYTVRLLSESGDELASVAGQSISFAEKINHSLAWTPQAGSVGNDNIQAVIEFAQDENTDNNSKELMVNVLTSNIESVSIGEANYPLLHNIPFNFFALYNLSQTLYPASQINMDAAPITAIQYICSFDEDVMGADIQVFLAETSLNNLGDGWIDPQEFTLVYDGPMDFYKGFNTLYIEFDEPYDYNGGNLVIYTNKSYPQSLLVWSTFISTFHESPIYSRNVDNNNTPYDAMNPPNGFPVFYTPDVTLFFASGELSVVDFDKSNQFVLFPNPGTDIVTIESLNNTTLQEVSILNANGQMVYQKSANGGKHSLDVSHLKSGFYLCQIKTENGLFFKKLIVK